MMNNPWSELGSASGAKKLRVQIELARRDIDGLASSLPLMKRDITSFIEDLNVMSNTIAARPDAWRPYRRFFVVDLPAVIEALQTLSACSQTHEGREELEAMLSRAMNKSADVRAGLEAAPVADSLLALSVIGLPEEPEPETNRRGLLGGLTGAMKSTSDAVLSRTGKVASDAYSQGGRIYDLAGLHAGQAYRDAKSAVIRPVTLRLTALTDSVITTGGSALVWGAIGTLIFPPLAPFLIGESLLSLPDNYTRQLSQLSEEDARKDLEEKGRTKREIDQIMAAIKGGAMRFETPCLSLRLDTREGQASGIILCGAYVGESLETLDNTVIRKLRDTAPDAETMQALSSWLARSEG